MFDKETIIVKAPNGISTRGLVEWLGQRSDADQLEVQSIVYRRTAHSPDEYLTVEPGITARALLAEMEPVIGSRTVIDWCVTHEQQFTMTSTLEAHNDYIGTRDEYADDLTHEALKLNDYELDGYDIKLMIDTDLQDGIIVEGVLTGDLFRGQ